LPDGFSKFAPALSVMLRETEVENLLCQIRGNLNLLARSARGGIAAEDIRLAKNTVNTLLDHESLLSDVQFYNLSRDSLWMLSFLRRFPAESELAGEENRLKETMRERGFEDRPRVHSF